jgi:hypothetical protein
MPTLAPWSLVTLSLRHWAAFVAALGFMLVDQVESFHECTMEQVSPDTRTNHSETSLQLESFYVYGIAHVVCANSVQEQAEFSFLRR